MTNSQRSHVPCAHCDQPIDINKYILTPPADWPSSSIIHLRKAEAGFEGAVRCPQCRHFTIYSRQDALDRAH